MLSRLIAYFESINYDNTNKSLWNICKPILGHHSYSDRILLVENNEIISNDNCLAKILNTYFANITRGLPIPRWHNEEISESNSDPIEKAVRKYASHPSIVKIKSNNDVHRERFEFACVLPEEVSKRISLLSSKKKVSGEIPTHILKLSNKVCTNSLTDCINNAINDCVFPNELKCADVTPVFKKGNKTDKSNYRPISILPVLSKVFERILYDQLYKFRETKLSTHLYGFRKSFYALLRMIENINKCLDKKAYAGAILMDLSNVFYTLNHELLISKLYACGFHKKPLRLIRII